MLFTELTLLADSTPFDGFYNMALDEVLLESATQPILRLYQWNAPWISFGYFGSLALTTQLHPNRPLVRRWTGGGIVEHGSDLTYSLIVPITHAFAKIPTAISYRLVHEAIAPAFGTDTHLAGSNPNNPPNPSCFAAPVTDDLLQAGVKIAGAAQRRTKSGLLHQGSVCPAPATLWSTLPALMATSVTTATLRLEQIAAAQKIASSRYGSASWLTRR